MIQPSGLPGGQLWPSERAALYEAVVRRRPLVALEIGTWHGGGSTFQIVSALMSCGRGRLITCEQNPEACAIAHGFYGRLPYSRFCGVYNCSASKLLPALVASPSLVPGGGVPDFIFFDGSEDPLESLNDFMYLDAHVRPGCVFMMHDWVTPESHKADLLRPYLEKLETWKIVSVLQPPSSVGLVEAVKL